jgi:DNA-3-methyladenine glycosylase
LEKTKNKLIGSFRFCPLSKDFYLRSSVEVAKDLLGKYFIRKYRNRFLIGKIVETEAYAEKNDQASHSFKGKTDRNKSMFEEGGILYVYFTYGVHYCANVVTEKKDCGQAVLIRAVEPIDGLTVFSINRFGKKNINRKEFLNLTNGPAKFCQAFGIDKRYDGQSLLENFIFIAADDKNEKVDVLFSERIGISKSKELLWRFYIQNNCFVSNTKNHR